jgi:hypothetical protein
MPINNLYSLPLLSAFWRRYWIPSLVVIEEWDWIVSVKAHPLFVSGPSPDYSFGSNSLGVSFGRNQGVILFNCMCNFSYDIDTSLSPVLYSHLMAEL